MNQTFDTRRFSHTLRHCITVRGRQSLSTIGVIICIIAVIDFFTGLSSYHLTYTDADPLSSMIEVFFWIGLIVIVCVCAGNMFKPLSKKNSATSVLMLPASQLEKYLCLVIIGVILPPVAYMIGFEILEFLRCLILNLIFPAAAPAHMVTLEMLFADFGHGDIYYITMILFLQSCFVLGSCIWPRRGVTYTVIAILILIFAFSWWSILLLHGTGSHIVSFGMHMWSPAWLLTFILAWTLLHYVVAYYRYKEAEIINRF